MPRTLLGVNQSFARRHNISIHQQIAWLERSSQWADHDQAWKPVRFVGGGANGIVGLWHNARARKKRNAQPKDIIVKQALRVDIGLQDESKAMNMMMNLGGFEHCVKLYKVRHTDAGSGTMSGTLIQGEWYDRLDPYAFNSQGLYNPGGGDVARIYMEYCPGGDVQARMDENIQFGQYVPEELIWRIFHCLAMGCSGLENGIEGNAPGAPHAMSIIHNDIKPVNIFIGAHGEGHERMEIFKLGDFGLAQCIPHAGVILGDPHEGHVWRDNAWRGTPGYFAPEQLQFIHPQRRVSSKSNIWQIGTVIHELMTVSRNFHQTFQTPYAIQQVRMNRFPTATTTHPGFPNTPFDAYGENILNTRYSTHLIELVHRCLAHNPLDRPNSAVLITIINTMLKAFNNRNELDYAPGEPAKVALGHFDQLPSVEIYDGHNSVHPDPSPRPIWPERQSLYPPIERPAPGSTTASYIYLHPFIPTAAQLADPPFPGFPQLYRFPVPAEPVPLVFKVTGARNANNLTVGAPIPPGVNWPWTNFMAQDTPARIPRSTLPKGRQPGARARRPPRRFADER